MAVTALRGKIDLASFEEEYLQSEQVRQLMAKVKVSASTELDRYFPKYWPGRVTVKLAGGHEHTEEIIAPKGESENPMTRQDVEEKFLGLAAPLLGEGKTRAVIDEVSRWTRGIRWPRLLAALVIKVLVRWRLRFLRPRWEKVRMRGADATRCAGYKA